MVRICPGASIADDGNIARNSFITCLEPALQKGLHRRSEVSAPR